MSEVSGSAYGFFTDVSLFGSPSSTRGPTPTVTLPPGGSPVPVTASAPSGLAQYGPAVLFTSGPLNVSTQGTTGPAGSVTSSSSVLDVGPGPFTADEARSTCTAAEAATTGSTTLTNGQLVTSEGDPNVEGDETVVTLPASPAPNTEYTGNIESVGDTYRAVFNEQVTNPDGSITVNAAHLFLLGPTAVGDLIIGQAVCDVTVMTTSTSSSSTSSSSTSSSSTSSSSTSSSSTSSSTTSSSTTSSSTTSSSTTSSTVPPPTSTVPPPTGPECQGEAATIVGTSGDDFLQGTDGRDVIVGRGGDDYIVGYGGDDLVCAGAGSDRVVGGRGNDQLLGGTGSDHVIGGTGEDQLDGGSGSDQINGGSDNDSLLGGNGTDDLNGAAGDDQVDGGSGDDACKGGGGSDNLANCEG